MRSALELFKTKSGHLSARKDNYTIYSAYDPEKEAERYVRERLQSKNPVLIIILGEGFGYLSKAVQKYAPQAKVLSVYFSSQLKNNDDRKNSWDPASSESIPQFLERNLNEIDPYKVEIIEWPAAKKIFPELAEEVKSQLLRILRENSHSLLTMGALGRLWFRNVVCNFLNIESFLLKPAWEASKITVITAAGPSLFQVLGLLSEIRSQVNLLALASSLKALEAFGLKPDLVITTDGTFWADYLLKSTKISYEVLAMPLSASRAASKQAKSILLFCQPLFLEEDLCQSYCGQITNLPAYGTVAGSALSLALTLGTTAVVFLGLDLCFNDLQTHVKPHPFTLQLETKAGRFNPHHSQLYSQAIEQAPEKIKGTNFRVAPAHKIYAASFSSFIDYPVYRVGLSTQPLAGIKSISEMEFLKLVKNNSKPKMVSQPVWSPKISLAVRKDLIKGLLQEYMALIREANFDGFRKIFTRVKKNKLIDLFSLIGGKTYLELLKYMSLQFISESKQYFSRLVEEGQLFLKTQLNKYSR